MSGARAAAPADKEGDRGRVVSAKVERYWAGKRIDGDATIQGTEETTTEMFVSRSKPKPKEQVQDAGVNRTPVAPAVIVKKADDRLARLARADVAEGAPRRHRRRPAIEPAQVVHKASAEKDIAQPPSTDGKEAHLDPLSDAHPQTKQAPVDVDVTAERQARREKALKAQQKQEAAKAAAEESESEYETDESEDDIGSSDDDEQRMAKPVFVLKADRETVLEKERAELEAMQLKEAEQKRLEDRVKETNEIVASIVDQEKNSAATKEYTHLNTASDIDTDDDTDEEELEFEKWKRRELDRIMKEEALRGPAAAAAKDTDEAGTSAAARGKLKFMQKYYHKGAFFQTNADDDRGTIGGDAIYTRDYTGATGEDKFDKEALPAVMQVKNFGRAGRTKWKHLAAEDTTFAGQDASMAGQKRAAIGAAYPADAENEVFAKVRQAVEAKGAGRAGALGDELARPKRTRT